MNIKHESDDYTNVIGALGIGTEGLGNERTSEDQTTALVTSARILRRVLEIFGDLLSLKLQ